MVGVQNDGSKWSNCLSFFTDAGGGFFDLFATSFTGKKQESDILLPYADLSTRSILQILSLKPENASFYMCRKNATEKFG